MQLFACLDRMDNMSQLIQGGAASGGPVLLGDDDLLVTMKRLSLAERTLSAYALAHLGEIWRRRLYAGAGFASMFAYCTGELRYSEATAYRRIQAIQATIKFPEILSLIKSGDLTLCALALIAKHLTTDTRERLLGQLQGRSVRAVERLVAELAPLPDTRDMIRSEPPRMSVPARETILIPGPPDCAPTPEACSSAASPPAPRPPDKIMPRSPERVQFGFTGSEELRGVVTRCRELLCRTTAHNSALHITQSIGRARVGADEASSVRKLSTELSALKAADRAPEKPVSARGTWVGPRSRPRSASRPAD
jgi:hypothetical protein